MDQPELFEPTLCSFTLSVSWRYPGGWTVAASERREGETVWRHVNYEDCSGSEARQVALEVLLQAFAAYDESE